MFFLNFDNSRKSQYIFLTVVGLIVVAVYTFSTGQLNLGVGIIVAVSFAVFFWVSPKHAICAVLATRTLLDLFKYYFNVYRIDSIDYFHVNINVILGTEVVVLACVYFIVKRRLPEHSFVLPALCFSVFIFISLIFSADVFLGFGDRFRWISWIFMLLLVVDIFRSKEDILLLIKSCAIAAIIPVCFSIYGVFSGAGASRFYANLPALDNPRLDMTGFYIPDSSLGMILNAVLPFLVLYFFSQKSVKLYLGCAGLALVALSIFFSFTRTAWLALLIFSLTMLFYRFNKKLVILVFMIFAVVLALNRTALEKRFVDVSVYNDTGNIRKLAQGRVGVWIDSFNLFIDHDFVSPDINPSYSPLVRPSSGEPFPYFYRLFGRGTRVGQKNIGRGSDNDYLTLLLDAGLIGLGLYLWLLYRIFRDINRMRKAAIPSDRFFIYIGLATFFVYLGTSMIGQLYSVGYQWYFGAFLGILFATFRNTITHRDAIL